MPSDQSCLVVVPLRSFDGPKTRLSEVLSPEERVDLTRRLADGVMASLASHVTAVVTNDADVREWAAQWGAEVVEPATPGLDAAASAGRDHAAAGGYAQVAVVHADLAAPGDLSATLTHCGAPDRVDVVAGVPDHRNDGTNVLVVPTSAAFRFHYGPGSFDRHATEAARLGLAFEAVLGTSLGHDVDTAEDLAWYVRSARGPSMPT
ncbi:MAG: 2-phospho-L-lactate guanylyltransferase [Acidimicrobiales bacterium]